MPLARALAVLLALMVLTTACQTATNRTVGQTVDDTKITAAVKAKLVADRPANLTRVDVDTTNGVVYLKGSVDSPEDRMRAEQLTREARGVTGVVNQLQVATRR